ncbi:hypothetical protein [Streptomyces gossypiisoli]|uniref:hypothetical protein n=1 Tax=Streptomyces gossypiisoli TaxID=2748864 RepID=UPI0015D9E7B7|nr:hypothetical protein [Streptomyces gossypiisoli]
MSKLIRRVATSTVSVALAGIALVGTAGSASAEPLSTSRDRQDTGVGVTERRTADHHVAVRYGERHDRDGRRHDRNGQRRWHQQKDDRGYWYYSLDRRHHYRYDGHRLVRWVDGRWVVIMVTDRLHDVDDWYFDQLRYADQHDGHKG